MPPPAEQPPTRLQAMCDFANEGETPESGVDYCLAQIA
jgi:hypothetical protein